MKDFSVSMMRHFAGLILALPFLCDFSDVFFVPVWLLQVDLDNIDFFFCIEHICLNTVMLLGYACLALCASYRNVRIAVLMMSVTILLNTILWAVSYSKQYAVFSVLSPIFNLFYIWGLGVLYSTSADRNSRGWVALVVVLNIGKMIWTLIVSGNISSDHAVEYTMLCMRPTTFFIWALSIFAYWKLCHSDLFMGRREDYGEKTCLVPNVRYFVSLAVTAALCACSLVGFNMYLYAC